MTILLNVRKVLCLLTFSFLQLVASQDYFHYSASFRVLSWNVSDTSVAHFLLRFQYLSGAACVRDSEKVVERPQPANLTDGVYSYNIRSLMLNGLAAASRYQVDLIASSNVQPLWNMSLILDNPVRTPGRVRNIQTNVSSDGNGTAWISWEGPDCYDYGDARNNLYYRWYLDKYGQRSYSLSTVASASTKSTSVVVNLTTGQRYRIRIYAHNSRYSSSIILYVNFCYVPSVKDLVTGPLVEWTGPTNVYTFRVTYLLLESIPGVKVGSVLNYTVNYTVAATRYTHTPSLLPMSKYQVTVAGVFETCVGNVETAELETARPPKLRKILPISSNESTVLIKVSSASGIFISDYWLLVEPTSYSAPWQRDLSNEEKKTTRQSLNQVMPSINYYICARLSPVELPSRGLYFRVGDNSTNGGYWNLPLQTGHSYKLRVAAKSAVAGTSVYAVSEETLVAAEVRKYVNDPPTSQSFPWTATVGGAAAAAVLLLLLVLLILWCKKVIVFNCNSKNEGQMSKSDTEIDKNQVLAAEDYDQMSPTSPENLQLDEMKQELQELRANMKQLQTPQRPKVPAKPQLMNNGVYETAETEVPLEHSYQRLN